MTTLGLMLLAYVIYRRITRDSREKRKVARLKADKEWKRNPYRKMVDKAMR